MRIRIPAPDLFDEVAEQIPIRPIAWRAARPSGWMKNIGWPNSLPGSGTVPAGWAAGWPVHSFSVEAATFRELGGFSNELFAAEELELSQRLKQLVAGKREGAS